VNGKKFESDVIEAVFLSPAVAEALITDISLRKFVICDVGVDGSIFPSVPEFLHRGEIHIDRKSMNSLIDLSRYLGNRTISDFLISQMFCKSGDQFGFELPYWSWSLSSSILDQIASIFSSHSKDDISLFDIETLHDILSKDSLKITSEDWLLQMIIDLGSHYSSLFGELC
jgi:hypothetical protein